MAQTIPDITVTTSWQSLNTLSGIAVGEPMFIQNKGRIGVYLAEGTQPSAGSKDGVYLGISLWNSDKINVESGSLEIWVRSNHLTSSIHVE